MRINFSRLSAAVPFIFIVAGLGTASIWAWIESRRRFPYWIGYFLLALVLLFGLLRQWDYVSRIRPYHHLTYGRHILEFTEIGKYIGNHLDRPILLPTYQYQYVFKPHAFLLTKHFPSRRAGWDAALKQGEKVTVIQLELPNEFPEEWVLLKDGTVHFLPPMPEIVEPLNGERTAILNSNGARVAEAFEARWQGERRQFAPIETAFEII